MGDTTSRTEPEHLSVSACWGLLRRARTGRVGIIRDGAPDILPVNHLVDRGSIVYRTGTGVLFAATLHTEVAFEVDGYDEDDGTAWSVVVRGRASEGRSISDLIETSTLPVHPWQAGPKPRHVRIEPTEITGRRFVVAPGHRPRPVSN